ncbi:hypothetical protein N7519_007153 [Penicillium mononematosum]|uniref:uncharacterized protein n=1 Tax=Penicillium mononematosum TaxID=268346 RepID=UPI002546CEE8|nr:uncharacterized protein N7519_007153 [Penicillium mononematosum]KAJ6185852.1 hypothetical protein N7519_007153 [Penicillium mononematosum]
MEPVLLLISEIILDRPSTFSIFARRGDIGTSVVEMSDETRRKRGTAGHQGPLTMALTDMERSDNPMKPNCRTTCTTTYTSDLPEARTLFVSQKDVSLTQRQNWPYQTKRIIDLVEAYPGAETRVLRESRKARDTINDIPEKYNLAGMAVAFSEDQFRMHSSHAESEEDEPKPKRDVEEISGVFHPDVVRIPSMPGQSLALKENESSSGTFGDFFEIALPGLAEPVVEIRTCFHGFYCGKEGDYSFIPVANPPHTTQTPPLAPTAWPSFMVEAGHSEWLR